MIAHYVHGFWIPDHIWSNRIYFTFRAAGENKRGTVLDANLFKGDRWAIWHIMK